MADVRANLRQPAGPLDSLGDPVAAFKNPAQLEFIRTLVRFLKDGLSRCISRDRAAPFFHLQSPAGKVFRVSVQDDGTLETDYVRG